MSRHVLALPLVLFGLSLTACSADPLNIVILNARAPGDKCDFEDATLYTTRGQVDYRQFVDPNGNAGQSAYYFQQFSWENQLQPNPISVNGELVDPSGGNDFIADTIIYDYQYTDPSVTLEQEIANVREVIPAGAKPEDARMLAELIQPKAATALNATLTATPQTLLVTFQVFGKLVAGTPKYTNKVSFPVTVFKSAPAPLVCPAGSVLFVGPCGDPGRDTVVHCIKSGS
jgi:hypothetical protein